MTALLQRVTGLVFLAPGFLLAAVAVALALLARRRLAPALRFAPAGLVAGALPRTWRVALLPLPRALETLGLLCAIVALARPVERELLPRRSQGIDVLLCLDTSSSMTANDMDPRRTRLEVARDAAVGFVRGRPDDRIGLVVFARYPDLRCPLTRDHEALAKILAEVAPVLGDGPEDATGVGTAVAEAARVLAGPAPRSRVVVLFTDGEENVATPGAKGEIAPSHAAQFCRTLGVKVHAVAAGVGRADRRGALARVDTGPIARLAAATGGTFHEAPDAEAVAAVYAQIDAMEKSPVKEARFAIAERYLPFLLAAVALYLAGRLLGATALDVLP